MSTEYWYLTALLAQRACQPLTPGTIKRPFPASRDAVRRASELYGAQAARQYRVVPKNKAPTELPAKVKHIKLI